MVVEKLVIRRRMSYRYVGIGKAAKALGVSTNAVKQFLDGRTYSLSRAKRDRIEVVDEVGK